MPNIHRNTSTTSGAQSPGPLPLHHLLSSELKGAGKGLGTFLSFLVAEINFSFLSEWSYERIRLGGKLLISKNFSPSLKYTYFWKHFYSISYHLNINKLIKRSIFSSSQQLSTNQRNWYLNMDKEIHSVFFLNSYVTEHAYNLSAQEADTVRV